MIIRRFEPDDAIVVSQLIIDNLFSVNIHDYGEEAVRFLAQSYTPELLLEYTQNSETFVALLNSDIVGTATLQQNYVRNVFVKINQHKQGIGKILMAYIENIACQQKIKQLVLRASLSAVVFYEKMGYQQIGKEKREMGSVQIITIEMEKRLS
jgi:N-acetylglutamate synthase-like GNAT family acetyltransferase